MITFSISRLLSSFKPVYQFCSELTLRILWSDHNRRIQYSQNTFEGSMIITTLWTSMSVATNAKFNRLYNCSNHLRQFWSFYLFWHILRITKLVFILELKDYFLARSFIRRIYLTLNVILGTVMKYRARNLDIT